MGEGGKCESKSGSGGQCKYLTLTYVLVDVHFHKLSHNQKTYTNAIEAMQEKHICNAYLMNMYVCIYIYIYI